MPRFANLKGSMNPFQYINLKNNIFNQKENVEIKMLNIMIMAQYAVLKVTKFKTAWQKVMFCVKTVTVKVHYVMIHHNIPNLIKLKWVIIHLQNFGVVVD